MQFKALRERKTWFDSLKWPTFNTAPPPDPVQRSRPMKLILQCFKGSFKFKTMQFTLAGCKNAHKFGLQMSRSIWLMSSENLLESHGSI